MLGGGLGPGAMTRGLEPGLGPWPRVWGLGNRVRAGLGPGLGAMAHCRGLAPGLQAKAWGLRLGVQPGAQRMEDSSRGRGLGMGLGAMA